MKHRWITFLTMLFIVIALGTGATVLNLRLQKSNMESQKAEAYILRDQQRADSETGAGAPETQAAVKSGAQYNMESPLETVSDDISGSSLFSDQAQLISEAEEERTENLYSVPQDTMPADPSGMESVTQAVSGDDKAVYYARLQDMERAYNARMNAVIGSSLNDQQKVADELLEIWDDELNAIYQKLRASLSDDDFRVLRSEERAWIRNRDTAAGKAAAGENYSKNAQNLAYTRSLLQWTKERVYELAEMYYGK